MLYQKVTPFDTSINIITFQHNFVTTNKIISKSRPAKIYNRQTRFYFTWLKYQAIVIRFPRREGRGVANIFLFSNTLRLTLGPTQSFIQWYWGSFAGGEGYSGN